ncbi:hypothetical protein HMPREF0201_01898 [Cedecea davisae DSM 4568]|uniref:Uncharacterized protein n=1 Tax=Cedecea davisae DSM 4568 TaxID=566551 RepID=S3JXZ4_9ENTR|nr:hypothetical protein HMPREF0201_01898 [Cedecea davisae DSM 4568]
MNFSLVQSRGRVSTAALKSAFTHLRDLHILAVFFHRDAGG